MTPATSVYEPSSSIPAPDSGSESGPSDVLEEPSFSGEAAPIEGPAPSPVDEPGAEEPHAPEPSLQFESSLTDEEILHAYCSASATKCERTPTGVYEEILVGDAYSLGSGVPGESFYGLKRIDTLSPTRPGSPFAIRVVSESQRCGESSWLLVEVAVVCPPSRFYCEQDGNSFCSPAELCVDLQLGAEDLDANDGLTEARSAPVLQLRGPESVEVTVGDNYTACLPCLGQTDKRVCDEGADAWDSTEGNLTPWVEVCSAEGRDHRLDRVGLEGCFIDTSTPGVYNITFSVADSVGQSVETIRRLTILPKCSDGEFVCVDVLRCSVQGSCFLYTGTVAETPTDVNLDDLVIEVVQPNNTMDLVLTDSIGSTVNVSVGQSYDKCEDGVSPTDDAKCEPGVRLRIFPGQETDYSIYVCPSGPCKHTGGSFCQGSLFSEHGLASCNIEHSTVPGAQYEIEFMAIPANASLPVLSASRYLILDSPCETDAYFCQGTCSPVPCDHFEMLTRDAPPRLASRFPDGLSFAYGSGIPISIFSCSTDADCGVRAEDDEEGDVTSSVTVTETTPCDRELGTCQYCHPDYLASGSCPPGYYRYQYAVKDSAQNAAEPVALEVNIVEFSELVIGVARRSTGGNTTASLLSEQPAEMLTLKESLLGALASGFEERGKQAAMRPEDLEVTHVDGDVMYIRAHLAGMGSAISTVNPTDARLLKNSSFSAHVPLLFNGSDEYSPFSRRRLLQTDAGNGSSFYETVASAENILDALDTSHLNIRVPEVHVEMLTDEVDNMLGAIVSLLGEIGILYQESVSQVETLIESVGASLPDTAKAEKRILANIDAMFSAQNNYHQFVEDNLNRTEYWNLAGTLEEMLNATRSAARQTMAMINAQLREMNHMRDYQVRPRLFALSSVSARRGLLD